MIPTKHIKPANETSQPTLFHQLTTEPPETLPILHQSCLQVLNLTADSHSSASDVGEVIMHDQALLANIIKIANSPAYHTRTPVKAPTHAVTIIGFDVIRAIVVASHLVEHAQQFGANAACLKRLLARSLVAATEAVELGRAIEFQDEGFLFTNAMLYTLGDLVLAFCHPEVFEQLEQARSHNPGNIARLEIELIGRPLNRLASAIAKSWHLPDSLSVLLEKKLVLGNCRQGSQQQQLEGLVYAANELSQCLLSAPSPGRDARFTKIMEKLPGAFRLKEETIANVTVQAFTKACQFSDVVKIHGKYFLPKGPPAGASPQSAPARLTRDVVRAVTPLLEQQPPSSSADAAPAADTATQPDIDDLAASASTDTNGVSLNDFALQAMHLRDPHKLLTTAARTLATTCQFERVVLMLVVPSAGTLEGRIAHGPDVHALLPLFQCSLADNHLFAKSLTRYAPTQISSLEAEAAAGTLPSEFVQQWGEAPCFIGSLFSPNKPIGVLLADLGAAPTRALTDENFGAFSLVLSVINANLARLSK